MTMSILHGLICFVSDNIPRTQCLVRKMYCYCIKKSSLQAIISPPPITDFGWEIKDGQVLVKWMTMPVAPDGILEDVKCGCKSGCSTRRCACVKAELKCTGLCGFNGCVNFDGEDNSMTVDGENDEFDDDVEADDVFG